MPLRKISAIIVSAEKPALFKVGVGTVGTWVTAHEIQFYVGVATLIFMVMQIIVMAPKVRGALRQMAAEREHQRQLDSLRFDTIPLGESVNKKVSAFQRIRKFFRVGKK
ncbi:MAG: hypothetical protein LBI35_02580 [Burkholderiales bacterium]|jgi:hypothetical protein|nr:hypothetical protein [Burkholderiales bacterium]